MIASLYLESTKSHDLPVAYSHEDILSACDEPVWPLRGPAEEADLRRVADVFGRTLSLRYASPGTAAPCGELAVGLGDRLRGATQLYAHLTRRRAWIVESIDELERQPDARVLVCLWDQLTFAVLERVWSLGRDGQPLGIIVAADEESLRRQVLLRSAAAWLCAQSPTPVVILLPMLDIDEYSPPGLALLGGRAAPARVSAALGSGAGIVGMYAHADGLDSHLGGDKVTCPVKSRRDLDMADPPECVAAGYCHRLHLPLPNAIADERLIDSAALRCCIGVILTCFGIPATESIVPWQWSLLWSRLEAGLVGAMLTSWGLTTGAHGPLLRLAEDLAAGRSVGDALARSYRSLGDEAVITRVCLFGDPRVRAPRGEQSMAAIAQLQDELSQLTRNLATSTPDASPADAAARARTLERLIRFARAEAAAGSEPARLADDAARMLDELLALEPSEWAETAVEASGIAALKALSRARAYQLVTRLGAGIRPIPTTSSCPWCANPLRAFLHAVPQGAGDRVECWCERCGIVLNAEPGSLFSEARLTFSDRRLVLDPILASPDVHSVLIVERPPALPGIAVPEQRANDRVIRELPPGTNELVVEVEPGMKRCTLLVTRSLEIALLQGMVRFFE